MIHMLHNQKAESLLKWTSYKLSILNFVSHPYALHIGPKSIWLCCKVHQRYLNLEILEENLNIYTLQNLLLRVSVDSLFSVSTSFRGLAVLYQIVRT